MAIVGGIIVVALTQIPKYFEDCKTVAHIHDVMQLRAWLGYTDEHGRARSRLERSEGPLSVILTPIIDNTSCDEPIFVDNITLEIRTNESQYTFMPIYLTNIHPEPPRTEWLAIEDDFTAYSIGADESWNLVRPRHPRPAGRPAARRSTARCA